MSEAHRGSTVGGEAESVAGPPPPLTPLAHLFYLSYEDMFCSSHSFHLACPPLAPPPAVGRAPVLQDPSQVTLEVLHPHALRIISKLFLQREQEYLHFGEKGTEQHSGAQSLS